MVGMSAVVGRALSLTGKACLTEYNLKGMSDAYFSPMMQTPKLCYCGRTHAKKSTNNFLGDEDCSPGNYLFTVIGSGNALVPSSYKSWSVRFH